MLNLAGWKRMMGVLLALCKIKSHLNHIIPFWVMGKVDSGQKR